MVKYLKNNRGSFYIIVAVLCVANLMLGFELIKKITYKNVLPTINYTQLKQEKKSVDKDISNNIFLEILTSSNSYMKSALDEKYRKEGLESAIGNAVRKPLNFLNPRIYLKSQLPAMFSLVQDEDVRAVSNIYESGNKDKESAKNITSIINSSEDYGDKQVENTKDLIRSEKPKGIKLDDKNPYVMIYHSHATECYAPIKQSNYHIDKKEKNVIAIGEIIGTVLKEKGHKIKHVEKYHDLPSYNKSYTESLKTLQEELSKNESLKIILDVHRDGIDEDSNYIAQAQKAARVNINGKSVATFALVVGDNNPNKDQLLKFARYIRDKSNEKYPGLCKGIIIKPYAKFNQYVSDYHTLLEIGSNLNTLDESKETGKLVGEILDEVIVDLKEEK